MNKITSSIMIILVMIISFNCSQKTVGVEEEISPYTGQPVLIGERNEDDIKPILEKAHKENGNLSNQKFQNELPIDHKIKMGTLSNGMKYYIRKNKYPENRVALRLAVAAGSIDEDEGQEGMAHFIEHMCFNGTKSFAKDSLVKYLESVGTKFGPDLNAYTSFDETVYMLEVRADDQMQLENGLKIMKEWAGDVTFENEEIDKERGVVISEWRTGLSPRQRMAQKYFPVMYQNSKYAKRLPIGKVDVISNGEYETFKQYYRDWYRPDLMAIVVVGDIDVSEMEDHVKSLFGQLKNPISPRKKDVSIIPTHKGTLVSINTDKESAFSTVSIMNKYEHLPIKSMEDYKQSMKRELYNAMLSARLKELSIKQDPPFLYAYSGYSSDVGNLDVFRSFVSVKKGEWLRGMRVIMTENQRVLQHGFTVTEFKRAKIRMLKLAEKQVKEKDKLKSGRMAMKYVYNFLEGNPIPNPAQELSLIKTYLSRIKLSSINNLSKEWTKNNNRVVVLTGPPLEIGLPTEKDVLNVIYEVERIEVGPYIDKVSEGKWLKEGMTSHPITKDSIISDVEDMNVIYLNNGIKVLLKPTTFKNDEILMSAWSKGGNSLYNEADYKQASFTSNVINQSGVNTFSTIDMSKMFAGKDMGLRSYITTYYEGLSGKSSVEDFEWFLQWVNYSFEAPRFDDEVFSSFKTKYAAIYGNLLTDPQYYYQNEVRKVKYNNNYRSVFPSSDDIMQLKKDDIFRIHKERFANPADFTFCFVGNFKLNEMKVQLSKYLGSLQTNSTREEPKDAKVDLVSGRLVKRWKKGEAPKSYVGITYHGEMMHASEESYSFHTMTKILNIKLRERMREDMGGVYGVRVSGKIVNFPRDEYEVNISFNADPPMVDSLVDAVKDEIQKLVDGGVSQADLNKVIELQKQSKIKSLKENKYWLSKLTYYDKHDMHPKEISMKVLEAKMKNVMPKDISEMAKKYLNEKNSLWLIQDPE